MEAAQTWFRTDAPAFDPATTQAWMRLIKAFTLSFLLHLLLLAGLPVNPTGGVPQTVSTITARLQPAIDEPQTGPVLSDTAVVRESTPAPLPEKPASVAQPKPAATPEPPAPKESASSPSGGIELPFIRDPTYYSQTQLDQYPSLLTRVDNSCPDAARLQRISGHVRVLLLVDEFGVVNEASITEASPPGYFDEVTLTRFRAARFAPGQRQGHAVKTRIPLVVQYPCA